MNTSIYITTILLLGSSKLVCFASELFRVDAYLLDGHGNVDCMHRLHQSGAVVHENLSFSGIPVNIKDKKR
jgi:hypothetical protein